MMVKQLLFTVIFTYLTYSVCCAQLPQEASFCGTNETYYEGDCYEFVDYGSAVSYARATEVCQSRNGKMLAKISNAGIQSFIANSAEMRAWNRALIGLRLSTAKWTWAKDNSMLYGQGCYFDNTDKRDLNVSLQFMYTMKTHECVDFCRSQPTAKYAGVQGGRQCFCGSDYGLQPPTPNCNEPCGGDSHTFCGGKGANYIYAIDGVYSRWVDGRPANDGGCAGMILGQRALFPWQDYPCSTTMAHICQFDEYRDVSDVSAYFCLYTTCYVLYDLQRPWYAAREHCQRLGGDLMKIESMRVHSEVVSMLADHLYLGQVWIGASNGRWSWADGATVDFAAWSHYNNQPLVESLGPTCAELSSAETNYHWVTRDCNEVSGRTTFICQRPSAGATNNNNDQAVNNNNNNIEPVLSDGSISAQTDPKQQSAGTSSRSNSVYGVLWYGWLLIGLMIGLVVCALVFVLVWAFCLRNSNKNNKTASSARVTRSGHHHHHHQHHREGNSSSGLGSSVNSAGSGKGDRQRIIDDNHPMSAASGRPESETESGRRRSRVNSNASRIAPTPNNNTGRQQEHPFSVDQGV